MPKAKSRLAHNKSKKKVTFIEFGLIPRRKSGYVQKKSGVSAFAVLGLTILVCASLKTIPVLAKEPKEFQSPLVAIKEQNPVREVQSPVLAQPNEVSEPFPQASAQPLDRLEEISLDIASAVNEFIPEKRRSESLMIMHCLAHREAGHGASNAHGDNGKAGGPFQYWEDTWIRMRNAMIKEGVTTEISTRYDFKEAARTTAYAMSKGWAREWGPIFRDSKGSDFATCQTPSWYK